MAAEARKPGRTKGRQVRTGNTSAAAASAQHGREIRTGLTEGYDAQGFYQNGGIQGIHGHIGQPGTGKTYNALKKVRHCTRLLVWDSQKNVNSNKANSNRLAGAVIITSVDQLVTYWRRYRNGKFRIIYQPGMRNEDAQFEAVMRLCLAVGRMVVFIDEISFYCSANWMPEPLRYMSRAGRHSGISLIYTTQRPQIVAMDLRDNTNVFCVFRLEGEDAIAGLKSRIKREFLDQLPSLPDRAYVERDAKHNYRIVRG